jgi:large exoprotein involved in heme utilization and adhesion
VTLRAKDISVEDGALILTSNLSSPGSSGSILIQAGNNLSLTGGSQLRSSTSGQGNAGNISIQANGLVEIAGQEISEALLKRLLIQGQWVEEVISRSKPKT